MKKISVCLATYNGEKYIEEQIKSIINQTVKVDEIIISDNISDDNTKILINKLDTEIKIIDFYKQGRVALNFENALKCSSGDIIFLCDQDDVWKNTKVEECLKALEHSDVVIHNATLVDEKLQKINEKSFFECNGIRKGLFNNIFKSSYLGCSMAFKKEILMKALPFPKDFDTSAKPIVHGHDTWIGLIGNLYGNVVYLDKELILYRRHSLAVSESGFKSKRNIKEKLIWRWVLLKNLMMRKLENGGN